ncbi:MAG TPA: V-type ATP synthase subunit I [Thermoplasmata archaeon]
MLRPEEMTRAVIVGSARNLDATIECLYDLGVLHLIDFTEQDEEFMLGQPLAGASDASQKLLKLRAMIRTLNIDEHKPVGQIPVQELRDKLTQALATLDLNTSSKAEDRQRIQSLMRERESEIKSLEPFRQFGIPVEDFDGYDNVSSFVGICKTAPGPALSSRLSMMELFEEVRKPDVAVAVFVRNDDRSEVSRILAEHGFQEVKLPRLKGDPGEIIERLTKEIEKLNADLQRIETDLDAIRKKFADFIIASEEDLAIEVLKAETPLKIAASANSFVIDGWVPSSRLADIKTALGDLTDGHVFVDTVEAHKEEEPPVKLKNPGAVKPFEFLINLVSTPKYEEIDPTLILFITFPLFFGFMIGDLGFGLALAALGAFIRAKFRSSEDLSRLGTIILLGGIVAAIFGIFVFAEAFGIPFHPPEESPDEYTWQTVVDIPVHPMLDKMHDIQEMLAISLVAGWLHLSVGFIFGFVNNFHHNRKHSYGKVAWLVLLLGLFAQLMAIAGNSTATSAFINDTVLFWMPGSTIDVMGIGVLVPALAMILGAVTLLPFTEGALALTEVIGLFTNLVSYARLAALSVGKGAMALAFNSMLLPLVFDSGNILIAIGGALALIVSQLFFVFFLGALSSGIQAVRLNFVEFFLKFFEGGGTDFNPLKYERKHSVATK